ncbi:undecaprenyldiphospho-muramoylpentapeptidebeta-N-acetylglucosaminyltransferase [Actinomyces sp. Chiba101]|uniref:UDP-N-acetylglucosamine--N-acetylmuramyl-(pentapeptide) pyrophosphoryl-undecaprenol N-acetylglucosamine transferase n=1 Tax=Actinomyces denticolens TaxID=52767 RepID=A0ABY1ID86_9ACTO|nr:MULTISPECIES: UDP-N-acetylglucosamine--N-acetylmuramyl-(pentapeptide) pyrophosphoryl-undecaprenol N-acetylglucosamine transferase [Actinomyces]BAW92848.1 undecaprenyldiphospho-muramoylpentapeptidebeta-N-acetylglucosaminyltransferase [Actinomyces sp. Chiba101]GAV94179.1 undecaprenyldiphospho-muramoylpentapeptidebeta-N-acetylglucosaminyltransferase MurG [Actinomyces denticolens]SHI99528.1 UDP-N-acetylglucosamine-N-acetylmuramylpentapeptide N-acetylglucosamine transferase [Actinomyces denticolen
MPDTRPDDAPSRPLRVLLAGGGTAGHVNPLLATAAALTDPALGGDPGVRILVLGTRQGLEARLVPEAGHELAFIPRVPLPRRPSPDLLRLPGNLRSAVRAAREAIGRVEADVVVGFGGYVATPAYLAARRAGAPIVIHEQNARPGLANRLGARWARAVALTFASTPLKAAKGSTRMTGLPLRPAIAGLVEARSTAAGSTAARREAASALGLDPDRPTLLVTGGSLGAQRLNEVLATAMTRLPEELQVLHLTGKGKDAPVREALTAAAGRYPSLPDRYRVLDYLTTMEQAYACADGVVCRSGAGTVAELTALGLPALYVPLPIGNGEQRLNAADCVSAGGGRIVPDAELDAGALLSFTGVIADAEQRAAMARAASGVGVRDGAARLGALIRAAATSRADAEGKKK